jgi:hypothetical protein
MSDDFKNPVNIQIGNSINAGGSVMIGGQNVYSITQAGGDLNQSNHLYVGG